MYIEIFRFFHLDSARNRPPRDLTSNHQRCDTVLVELSGKRLTPQDRSGRRIQPQVELLRLSHQVPLAGDGQKHR
jgi:hypothetical protein